MGLTRKTCAVGHGVPPNAMDSSVQPETTPQPRSRTVQGRDGKSAFRFSSLNFDVYVLLRKVEKSAYQIRVSKVFSGKAQSVPILRIGVRWSPLTPFNPPWKLPQKWERQFLSHVQLSGTPWIAAHHALLSVELSRQESWTGSHALLRGSSWPRDQTWVYPIAGKSLSIWGSMKAAIDNVQTSSWDCIQWNFTYRCWNLNFIKCAHVMKCGPFDFFPVI